MLYLLLAGLIGGAVLVGTGVIWKGRELRARVIADEWARAKGHTLLDSELLLVSTGPFSFVTLGARSVVRISVHDTRGKHRTGWLRCGGWLFGMLTSGAAVKWD